MTLDFIIPKTDYATNMMVYINGEYRPDIWEVGNQWSIESMPISGVFKNYGEWIEDDNVLHYRAKDIPDNMVKINGNFLTIVHTADEIEELNTEDLFI